MYYVATGSLQGNYNCIGVAFYNDGVTWKKYPHPVILPETTQGYGVGQPAVYNSDQHAAIQMFYEDNCCGLHHVEAVSTDGVHFTVTGTLTANGLQADSQSWGDMAYDPQTGYWYAGFNTALRDPSTTGGVMELGQYGIRLYRIRDAALLTGATPWEFLTTVDTSLTGYESNFIPGFARDQYGNIIPGPGIQMFTSISNPPPPWNASPAIAGISGNIGSWKISSFTWTQNQPMTALNRYFNQTTHEVTDRLDRSQRRILSAKSTLGGIFTKVRNRGRPSRFMPARADPWTISCPWTVPAKALASWVRMVTRTPRRVPV